jgi:hypothetical protein
MKLNQLSIFLENKPGRLSEPCRILANAGINIITLSLADTQQFGILRLIVRDWQKARSVLKDAGCVVNVTEVLAVEVEDRPGGLENVLKIIEQDQLNVEYLYALTFRRNEKAVIIFRFENPDLALSILQKRGVRLIESEDIFNRVDQG